VPSKEKFISFDKKNDDVVLYEYINIDPEIMSGTPVFAGTRVPVQNLFDYIEGGDDLSEFLDDFPSVSKDIGQHEEVAKMIKITQAAGNILRLPGYYDGIINVNVIKEGFDTVHSIIKRIEP
jgi:uncharacterized protein (DUF433 family)